MKRKSDRIGSSWLKQKTTSGPAPNTVSLHLKWIRAETVKCEAAKYMRMFAKKKAMLLHYPQDPCSSAANDLRAEKKRFNYPDSHGPSPSTLSQNHFLSAVAMHPPVRLHDYSLGHFSDL
ncbi:hypothetical protein ACTXT7_001968 [Hymenolepis weldensis]